ncbi:MAG: hypothetical protein HND47_14155 [Chloroflexi bacterium]|nr:hypothetical protein [Chloroflexota bacterium]
MKKIVPLLFVIVGSALLITAIIFWIDSKTSTEPTSFGQSLRDWLTLIAGLGVSIKGWLDLAKKESSTKSTKTTIITSDNSQTTNIDNLRRIEAETYIENQVIQGTSETIKEDSSIDLTPEEESYYLNKYLVEVEKSTRKLPWDYTLGSISPEIEISKIYVSPSFAHQEYQRAVQVIMDEKQEREQERREKKIIAQSSSFIRPVLVDIYEIIRSKNPIAIIGYMGTGKSLAANYMAWMLAKREFAGKMGFSRPKTPIIVKLGDQSVAESIGLETTIFDIAAKYFPPIEKNKVVKVLRNEWKRGNVVLILDALDEYVGRLDWIKSEIEHLIETTHHANHVILTSRPSMYRLVKPSGFKIFELNEIESGTLDRYITKWVEALLEASERTNSSVETHIEFLISQISNHPLVEDMVSNPLLLTILVALSLTEDGIDLSKVKNETDLYSQYIENIIKREKRKPSFVSLENQSDLMLRIVYGYTGLLVHRARTQQLPEFPDVQYLVEKVSNTRYFSKIPNGVALTEACLDFWEKAGLFVDKENINKRIGFRHQAFQFFGAALGLMFLTEETREGLLRTVGNDPQWIDVLRLFLGVKPTSDLMLE